MTTAPTASRHAHEQHTKAPGYADHRADHLARLSKIEGQIRGISRMVTGDRYRIDVLTQITAASRALQEVALALLDDHVRGCVTDAARTDPAQAEEKFAELSDTLRAQCVCSHACGGCPRPPTPVAELPPRGILTTTGRFQHQHGRKP